MDAHKQHPPAKRSTHSGEQSRLWFAITFLARAVRVIPRSFVRFVRARYPTVFRGVVSRMPGPVRRRLVAFDPTELLVPIEALQERFTQALARVREIRADAEFGDYVEFGVSVGTSISCMDAALKAAGVTDVRIFGFDSFEGMPPSAADEDGGTWNPGDFVSSIGYTTANLQSKGVDLSRVRLIKGWFIDTATPSTARGHSLTKCSVVMIDCDIASATSVALEFIAPLVLDSAVSFSTIGTQAASQKKDSVNEWPTKRF